MQTIFFSSLNLWFPSQVRSYLLIGSRWDGGPMTFCPFMLCDHVTLFTGKFGNWTPLRWPTRCCSTPRGGCKANNWWEDDNVTPSTLTWLHQRVAAIKSADRVSLLSCLSLPKCTVIWLSCRRRQGYPNENTVPHLVRRAPECWHQVPHSLWSSIFLF